MRENRFSAPAKLCVQHTPIPLGDERPEKKWSIISRRWPGFEVLRRRAYHHRPMIVMSTSWGNHRAHTLFTARAGHILEVAVHLAETEFSEFSKTVGSNTLFRRRSSMSAPPPPPPPFAPPPPTTPPNVPGPGAKSHLLSPAATKTSSFSAETTETDPTLIALNEEVAQLKEEIRKLEKAPTSKQASERCASPFQSLLLPTLSSVCCFAPPYTPPSLAA